MIKGFRYYRSYFQRKKLFREGGLTPDDVFIVSYPKSGNTWVRFLVANALFPGKELTLRNLHELLPTVQESTAASLRALPSPRFIKTHGAFFSLYPKSVYITRDYRDVIVSAFHHFKNRNQFDGDLSAFVSSGKINRFGPWHWHIAEALHWKEKHPERIHFVRYEDLKSDTEKEVRALLEFCGISPSVPVTEIITASSFEKLRNIEEQAGGKLRDSSGNFFFRKGEAGGWKNVLTKEDEAVLLSDARTKKMLLALGYAISTER